MGSLITRVTRKMTHRKMALGGYIKCFHYMSMRNVGANAELI
jgi:hypothetical protein